MESALISRDATMQPIERIVAQCRQGDRSAFDVLFERYHARVYRLAYGILRREAEAEDVVQDTFLKAYRHIDRFQGKSSFETWLVSIAVNCCRDRMRRRKVRRFLSLENVAPRILLRAFHMGQDPAAAVSEREEQHTLWQAVAELDERLRLPIVLRYQEGLSCGQIAEVLDLSLSTIYTQLSEGRQELRELLGVEKSAASGE